MRNYVAFIGKKSHGIKIFKSPIAAKKYANTMRMKGFSVRNRRIK